MLISRSLCFSFLICVFFFSAISLEAQQTTAIIVNSAEDPGTPGDNYVTLREAINFATGKATASGGELAFVPPNYGAFSADTILFDPNVFPPNEPKTIYIIGFWGESLNTGEDTIDGSNAGVILDGSRANGNGITILSSKNTVRGLQIVKFPGPGITISDSNGEASDNIIGGDRTAGAAPLGEGLLISGNAREAGDAIHIEGIGVNRNKIYGCNIGLDISGKSTFSNYKQPNGIRIMCGASRNTIGAVTPSYRNVISGNDNSAISIFGSLTGEISDTVDTSDNIIIGNYLGTDVDGTNAIGNSFSGIVTDPGAKNTKIYKNLLSGNKGDGISLFSGGVTSRDFSPSYTIVEGNFIGTDITGKKKLANNGHGISICFGSSNNRIGGDSSDSSNIIMFNNGAGIHLYGSTTLNNKITKNRISSNQSDGIWIQDNLANKNIQPPIITFIDSKQVSGTCSTPDGSAIEIFNDLQDEGETYLGSAAVSGGKFTFTGTIPTTGNITTTVTDLDGNTSAFSVPHKNPYAYATPTPTRTPRSTATPKPTPTPTLPASANTVITVGTITGKPGDTIIIPITIIQSPKVSAFQFDLEFDSRILSYQSISKEGTLSKDFILVDGNILEPGKLRVAASAFTAQPFSGNGVIVNLQFKLDANATDGETTLTLSNLKDDILGAKTVPGKVVISSFLLGDVNGDGSITTGDAQLAFDFAIGKKKPTETQIKAGDIDGNGEITAGDAQKIFYLSIGKKTNTAKLFPVFSFSAQKVSLGSATGKTGEEVWLPVILEGGASITSYTFDVLYNPQDIEYLGIKKEGTASSKFLLVEGNVITEGHIRVGGAALSAEPISGDGTLVFIGFKIKQENDSKTELTLLNLRDDISGAIVQGGEITVTGLKTITNRWGVLGLPVPYNIQAPASDARSQEFQQKYFPTLRSLGNVPSISDNMKLDGLSWTQIDPMQMILTHDTQIRVYYIVETGGYMSSLGMNLTGISTLSGNPFLVFPAMSKDNDNPTKFTIPDGCFVDIDQATAGNFLNVFMIPDGGNFFKTYTDYLQPHLLSNYSPANPDNCVHAKAYAIKDSPFIFVSFEDYWGLSDKNYRDVLIALDIGIDNVRDITSNPRPQTIVYDPADENINDSTHFPSNNFRRKIEQLMEVKHDQPFSSKQTMAITGIINCRGYILTDIKGMEYFPNLTGIDCGQNKITKLDVSQFTHLRYLVCDQMATLQEIIFSASNEITWLNINCSGKKTTLTKLDISSCPRLQWLWCQYNALPELDISHNPLLRWVDCSNNPITKIQFSQEPMIWFNCSKNQLTEIPNWSLLSPVFSNGMLDLRSNKLTQDDWREIAVLKKYFNPQQPVDVGLYSGIYYSPQTGISNYEYPDTGIWNWFSLDQ